MNINLKDSDEHELMTYQIALLNIQVHINKQLIEIKNKLDKIRRKNKNVKWRRTVKKNR